VGATTKPRSFGVGDVVLGKYRLERVLGVGGMGYVVAARHLEIGELVAIKMLSANGQDAETVERFVREARATARLKSDHVVRVLDASRGDESTPPYILMEYLEGEDLAARLRRAGPLPIAEAVDFVLQAGAALAEAHSLGIVHRDVKPSNLLCTTRTDGTPVVKVLDFGISKSLEGSDAASPSLTDTRSVFGSPMYMSPEQIRSAKHVDLRSDIWSLGVVLFELLTARAPFVGETTAALLAAISADLPQMASTFRPEVPWELDAVIYRCLEKDRTRRFQSIAELAAALRPFASSLGAATADAVARIESRPRSSAVPAPLPSQPSVPAAFSATERAVVTTDRRVRRGSVLWIGGLVGAVAVALLLLGGGVMALQKRRAALADAPPPAESAVTDLGPTAPAPTVKVEATPAQPPPTASPRESAVASPPVIAPQGPVRGRQPRSVGPVASASAPAAVAAPSAPVAAPPPTTDPFGNRY